ncbi:hypothetical protein QYF36_018828 [Acer negundo]|nr:hypothetical protein QYF36_018828 [Acer negundo]
MRPFHLKPVKFLGLRRLTREVIKKYVIQEGSTLKKIKNDRSVKGSHSMCLRLTENKESISRWVASVLENFIRSNRNGKAKLFKDELFVNGCHPLTGVDECHLSGKFGEVLLSAIAFDGDNNILPIAICIYESENSNSWSWFLKELRDLLG